MYMTPLQDGSCALHFAIRNRRDEVVHLLAETYGAIYQIVMRGHVESLKLLVDKYGISPNACSPVTIAYQLMSFTQIGIANVACAVASITYRMVST